MKIKEVDSDVLFPTPLWIVDYEDFESVNRTILDEMDKVDWDAEHQRHKLGSLSEHRHREDTFITVELVPSAKVILDAFGSSCAQIGQELGWDMEHNDIRVEEMWAHITPPGKNTQTHDHAGAHLSCTYYVRAPKACGNLRFVEDRKHRFSEPAGSVIGMQKEVAAKEGRMVIFPAWVSHYVDENRSGETRVSLSFNASLVPNGTPK